jgi:hypothetical protein
MSPLSSQRRVRGLLFLDYVRMMRGRKDVNWAIHLTEADMAYLQASIDVNGWYPMETFERMGNAILRAVAGGQLEGVRMWGRFQTDSILRAHPQLLGDDTCDTLRRFQVLRAGFFDYDALDLPEILVGQALVRVDYRMGKVAEEAACHQALGFFERLVETAGGTSISASFRRRSWVDGPPTEITICWQEPPRGGVGAPPA